MNGPIKLHGKRQDNANGGGFGNRTKSLSIINASSTFILCFKGVLSLSLSFIERGFYCIIYKREVTDYISCIQDKDKYYLIFKQSVQVYLSSLATVALS